MNEYRKNPMYLFLMVLTICATGGLQAWRTLFDNFAVNVVVLDGEHIGAIQSIREIPGFLALLAIYFMLIMKEHRLSALSILVLGLGISMTGLLPSFAGLAFTTLIMSFGFHYFETTNMSLTLQYFDENTSPIVFGRLRSVAAASNIVVGLLIFFMAYVFGYTSIYLILGGAVVISGVWALTRDPADRNMAPQRKTMILKRKYGLFYFLTFLAGARRQIFIAFAVFLLVKKFGFTLQDITILFFVNNAVNYFLNPFIGKCIIRFGERKVLSLEYFSLIFVFLAYAVVESGMVAAVLYILDHIFFNFAVAIRTYFQKIGEPEDIAPSMAVGFTINHIAAVFFPVIGGMLWMIDYRIPFVCGAMLSLVSLLATQKIVIMPRKIRRSSG